jgi:hypothetical protein
MTKGKRPQAQRQESREGALGHLTGQFAEMQERITELQDFVDEHMGYSPDEVNWGHVGTAGHFLKKLTELTDWAYKRGEYAE